MNLNERAMEYARNNNYYKLSKIKKFLRLEDKEYGRLKSLIPKAICPDCGSEGGEIEYSDCEYSSDRWVVCSKCGELYDNDSYIDAVENLEYFNWHDGISTISSFGMNTFSINSWREFCDETINRMISELETKSQLETALIADKFEVTTDYLLDRE